MEDVKKYIESGILELYVIGDLSFDERLIVEMMAAKYPEIKEELAAIEKAFEGYANENAIDPDEQLRDKVLRGMFTKREIAPPAPSIISMQPGSSGSSAQFESSAPTTSLFYKYAFAASVALLLLSWFGLYVLNDRLQKSNEQIAVLEAANQKFAGQVNFIGKQLNDTKQTISVLSDPDFKIVKLKGTRQSPESSMLVAFNPTIRDVMIDMSGMKMPANDNEHQYQLWALVNGNPVDLGVFDMDAAGGGMKKMRSIRYAEAFAVTLEPRGGSISPTMEQMMVMGAI